MTESVIVRRLKSLRQRKQERGEAAKKRKEERAAEEARAERRGMPVPLMRAIDRKPLALPLTIHYGPGSAPGRDDAFWARRAQFYAECAMVFGFENWQFREPDLKSGFNAGYGGRGRMMQRIDQDSSADVNLTAAPLEYLVAKGWLESKKDKQGMGMVRFSTAVRFRQEVMASQIAALQGQGYEGAGGGGGWARPVSDYKLDCMMRIGEIRESMPRIQFRLLEQVVVDDVWLWERHRTWKQKIETIRIIQRVIDKAALVFGYLSAEDFDLRWRAPKRKPAAKSAKRSRAARQDRRSPDRSPASTQEGQPEQQP